VDLAGLPGDKPCNDDDLFASVSEILSTKAIEWCVTGEYMECYYGVPKVIYNIELCVPSSQLSGAVEAFTVRKDFCTPFRPPWSKYPPHVWQYPRFKVNGIKQFLILVPASVYSLEPLVPEKIVPLSSSPARLLSLPHFLRGILNRVNEGCVHNSFFQCLVEDLIDGVDIDEDWCRKYLEPEDAERLRPKVTPEGKQKRMGITGDYEGCFTSYIGTEADRQRARAVLGRDIPVIGSATQKGNSANVEK